MARTAAKHTQADIARVLRAAAQCGVAVDVVLEPDGRIRIVPSSGQTSQNAAPSQQMDVEPDIRL